MNKEKIVSEMFEEINQKHNPFPKINLMSKYFDKKVAATKTEEELKELCEKYKVYVDKEILKEKNQLRAAVEIRSEENNFILIPDKEKKEDWKNQGIPIHQSEMKKMIEETKVGQLSKDMVDKIAMTLKTFEGSTIEGVNKL
jgi:hypothetical protein